MPVDWRDDIVGIVEALRPSTLLAVMPEDSRLWRKLTQSATDTDCRRISGASLLARNCTIRSSQLALVAGTLEYMEKRQAGHVVARLRDLYTAVLYAAVPIGCGWQGHVSYWENQELIAYGLRRVRQYPVGGRSLCLYHYDIYDYKLTPDWLNSQYWANPHRWNKTRW